MPSGRERRSVRPTTHRVPTIAAAYPAVAGSVAFE